MQGLARFEQATTTLLRCCLRLHFGLVATPGSRRRYATRALALCTRILT